ncbi:MAG: hypothetical protein ACRD0X_07815, partial [Thermoanaerobaculia bacterium]
GQPGIFALWGGGLAGADTVFELTAPAGYPVVGDWDGIGEETVGVYDANTGDFHLRNENSGGPADEVRRVDGVAGEPRLPLAGNWEGSMVSVGLFNPEDRKISLWREGEILYSPIIIIIPSDPPCGGPPPGTGGC